MTIELTSTAFADGTSVPTRFTCDGPDLSPPLRWTGMPEGALSLALICDDPDAPAGTWVHWVLYDLPADAGHLAEGVPTEHILPSGAKQGQNDFGRIGYGGPCPPRGMPHRYFFKLYALDGMLDLGPGATKQDVEAAMDGHILEHGRLMGTYGR